MSAANPSMAALRLTGAGPLSRRALSVPVPRKYAPSADSIPDAGSIGATDPRWVLAIRAAAKLQGGRAAILAPEDRRRLVATGERLGLRAFDTGLIIAIVQDAARGGMDPLGMTTEGSLTLVRPPAAESSGSVLGLIISSVALGAAMFVGLLAWLNAV